MLTLPARVKVFAAVAPTDMRTSFKGLVESYRVTSARPALMLYSSLFTYGSTRQWKVRDSAVEPRCRAIGVLDP